MKKDTVFLLCQQPRIRVFDCQVLLDVSSFPAYVSCFILSLFISFSGSRQKLPTVKCQPAGSRMRMQMSAKHLLHGAVPRCRKGGQPQQRKDTNSRKCWFFLCYSWERIDHRVSCPSKKKTRFGMLMTSPWSTESHLSPNNGDCTSELIPNPAVWNCPICSFLGKSSSVFSRSSGFLNQLPTCFNICHISSSASSCHFCCFLSFLGSWRHPSSLGRWSIKITLLGWAENDATLFISTDSLPNPHRMYPHLPFLLAFQTSGRDFSNDKWLNLPLMREFWENGSAGSADFFF